MYDFCFKSRNTCLIHIHTCNYFAVVNRVITTSILGKRGRREVAKPTKITTWDREIICLPSCYKKLSVNGIMPIPRNKKDVLGLLELESDCTEDKVKLSQLSVMPL